MNRTLNIGDQKIKAQRQITLASRKDWHSEPNSNSASHHTPSPGASTAREKGFAGPAQGHREAETVIRNAMQ